MKTALLVAFGGAVGSLLRYAVGVSLARFDVGRLPLGTLSVNVIGSVLIGLVIGYLDGRGLGDSTLRIAMTVGVLGGFTTYSAFAFEIISLLEARALVSLSVYVLILAVLSLGGCAVGLWLGRAVTA